MDSMNEYSEKNYTKGSIWMLDVHEVFSIFRYWRQHCPVGFLSAFHNFQIPVSVLIHSYHLAAPRKEPRDTPSDLTVIGSFMKFRNNCNIVVYFPCHSEVCPKDTLFNREGLFMTAAIRNGIEIFRHQKTAERS